MSRILTNVKVFNVFRKEYEEKQVRIENGIFTEVEHLVEVRLDDEVIDGKGRKMIPGLIDIHMHIESSMSIPSRFEPWALKHGTTTVIADPHEIANVFGLDGINAFLDSDTSLDIFYAIPSSVPSTRADVETTGGVITTAEVDAMLDDERFRCLGEVMNLNDLISDDDTLIKKIIALCKTKNPWLPIEGHCAKISGTLLSQFIAAGVDSDHTQQTPASIAEKLSKGMFLEIQEKSLTKENVAKMIELQMMEHMALVSDDVSADHLLEGHLNHVIKVAMQLGMPEEWAIYCSTYTPARRMGFFDRGAIAPGRIADFILLEDGFEIVSVAKKGRFLNEISFSDTPAFPDKYKHSIQRKPISTSDLVIPYERNGMVEVNVMKMEATSNFTKSVVRQVPVINNQLAWWKTDLSLLCCLERHGKTGTISFGLVEGGITTGAVCTSWAHDHHNLMVMGTNMEDIVVGINHLIDIQGGYCVVKDKQVVACLDLPIGGIISDAPIEVIAMQLGEVRSAMHSQGYQHKNAIMSLATLSLPVSPELKLTDVGLFNTITLEKVPLIRGTYHEDKN